MTFQENERRLHSGRTRSSKMRLPAFGVRGSMSAAGVSRSDDQAAKPVAASVTPTPRPAETSAMTGSTGVGPRGTA